MFDALGVPYTIFVEAQEVDAYAAHVRKDRIHILPHRDKGLTVTRNYIWDFAASRGLERFWTFDDNIAAMYRFNRNLKVPCADATMMAVIENFADRYENIAITGMNYFMFVKRKAVIPPYILNTRVYSNMLIRTEARDPNGKPYRNVTFYNDDTDLCLRVLKDRWCTVLFNAFLIEKRTTMSVSGGMTEYYEKTDKRLEFVRELQEAHPELVKLTEKWGRYHHQVDYTGFNQPLRRKPGIVIPDRVNNFGMVLQERVNGKWIKCESTNGRATTPDTTTSTDGAPQPAAGLRQSDDIEAKPTPELPPIVSPAATVLADPETEPASSLFRSTWFNH